MITGEVKSCQLREECDQLQHLSQFHSAFYVRVSGNSMTSAGIHSGDLLVVDRSLDPVSGHIVIAVLNGELTVKRLFVEGDRFVLNAENKNYLPIEVIEPQELSIWGVATSVIHLL